MSTTIAPQAPTVSTNHASRSRWDAALSRARATWIQIPLLVGAGALLIGSISLPYWNIILRAPQYPRGLSVDVYVNKLEDMRSVREVDGLNHYIGMIKLTDAASIERAISIYAIALIALLGIASVVLPGRWRTVARLPIVVFPLVFVLDLFGWLYYAGHSLDPKAALSSSISEFTPRIFGTGVIGQFRTQASFQAGFWLAVGAALLALAAIVLDWRRRRDDQAS